MVALTLSPTELRLTWPAWRSHALAASLAVGVHAGVLVLLLAYQQEPLAIPTAVPVMTTQLISLPVPVAAPVSAPAAVIPPPPAPAPLPAVAKPIAPPVPVPDAALALKRQQRDEQQRLHEVERQQQRKREQDRERLEQESLARQADENRQREAAQLARQQAERAASAERERAALASRQYQPISKAAPEYPQRALDKNLQGQCTVSYNVDTQGRVQDPQVLGDCHPLFARPSLQAAKGFRYEPRIIEGRAVMVSGVKNTFHYRIE